MLRTMRRSDRQLSEAEAHLILEQGLYGVLATVCSDGSPYGVPMSYAADGNALYLHSTNQGGLKLENLARSPKACFTVVGEVETLPEAFSTRYVSAIAFGMVTMVADPQEQRHGLGLLLRKYAPDLVKQGMAYAESALHKVQVLRMDILSLTAKGRKA